MDINDRFLLFLREKRISQKEFCEKTGYLRQSLSKFITGTTKLPKIDWVIGLLEQYPELNMRWLLLGEGEMWLDTPISKVEDSEQIKALKNENRMLQTALLDAKDEIINLLKEKNELN